MDNIANIYKCDVCNKVVEIIGAGEGELYCDDKPMVLQLPKTGDGAVEKHIPIVEKTPKGYLVKVGSVAHPMEEAHYIQWIQLEVTGVLYRKNLQPGDKPEFEFVVEGEDNEIVATAYCNIHGLWNNL